MTPAPARSASPPGGLQPAPAIAHTPRTPSARGPSLGPGAPGEAGSGGTPARYDFHSHTFLTDGSTAATDMWHNAVALGHRALAVTDHLYGEDPGPMMTRLLQEQRAFEMDGFTTLVGVELSMLAPRKIEENAKAARKAGAEIVIVHGETPMEPVPPGTNRAAISCNLVDVLAHPGFLTEEDAEMARAHDVALELTPRRGHSWGNGVVARTGLAVGADLLVNSDAHDPDQLLRYEQARRVAAGAGVPFSHLQKVLAESPLKLLKRCGKKL